MNISKEDAIPTITISDVANVLVAAKWVDISSHELVFPSCLVENPSYKPVEADAKGEFLLSIRSWYKLMPVDEIAGKAWIFGYGIRHDPDATKLAVLPKQVEEPLPFE